MYGHGGHLGHVTSIKVRENRPAGSGEGFLKGFYLIWAWRPSWSCDPHAVNKLLFPLPKEAPDKIWL